MSGVNKVILVGRLGKDPEVRHLENGVAVSNFPIATSEVYRDRVTGERREQTEWHNIVLWRGLADIAEKYLKKGDMIYVEGKLRTRSWERDGITRYTTEIVGDNMTMLSGKPSDQGSYDAGGAQQQHQQDSQPQSKGPENPAASVATPQAGESETDDLPF
ncbi:MAG: single-stranded DNA-binding protein [Cyclobacteriaceae bacterium]|nr:single-stranded DNA-binding protein [Cyclobacteriaceae bacterium]